ncbi:MAG TPA: hypothetical protein VMX17_16310 [Candidatus Glassbacteria bacterium]|nr:hypothetical protein [Candidatus Glassbacteria bacterium]
MVCTRGEQVTPAGQSGIYFICHYGVNKGNHCRWAKWCSEARCYRTGTDRNGNACPDFSVDKFVEEIVEVPQIETEIEPMALPTVEPVEEPIEEMAKQPIEEMAEQPAEEMAEQPAEETIEEAPKEIIEEPFLKMVVKPVEEVIEQPIEEIVKEDIGKVPEEDVDEMVDETTNKMVSEIADEIFNNFVKQSESKDEPSIKIKFLVGEEDKKNIKYPTIESLKKERKVFEEIPIDKNIGKKLK